MRHFVLECTASYNIASRRYSIWTLLSSHIDAPLTEALKKLDAIDMFDGPFSKWLRNKRMTEMAIFLKALSRSSQHNPELSANIESLIEISYFILARRPSKKVAVTGEKGSPQLNHRKKVDHRHYPYCELCWRLSQAAERNIDHPEESSATQRYCTEHNPSIPSSKYRNDYRFRARFHEELRKLKLVKRQDPLEEISARALAYKNAHMKKTSLRNEIFTLHKVGYNQSEISKKLGVTRQAVSKSLKKTLAQDADENMPV